MGLPQFIFRVDIFDDQNGRIQGGRHEVIKNSTAVCLEENQTIAQHVEQGTDLSAHHYGVASFSYPKLLKGLLGSSKRGNLSECGVIAALIGDTVHPTELGRLLLADVLTLYLAKAQKYYQANKVHLHIQALSRQRVSPLFPQGVIVPRMTCYGMAAFLIRRQGPDTSETASSQLPVSNFSEGWEFVEMENNKYKPGWISNTSGSVLKMTVDVERAASKGYRQSIGLSFLTSYEHMGTAKLSCIEFCQCTDTLMDGHERVHRHSVPQMKSIVPQWPESSSTGNSSKRPCILQVEVLNKTYSGGHKFKVLQLIITTWVNISDYFSSFNSSGSSITEISAFKYK